ncbi:E3 ubiquitin-protein ligase RHF2A-like isoform X1 [Cucurbita moschata]|uniref:RING-type E3 ubiquitin transferase n=1 Tax=Cucurbita moschata TaxID=3662 RepID=A0A6J1EEX9_CUCMO|nr:E3 ubiquitin-protein ligase RHF2A-like isoform X1 [Cucurbita moschata]
MDVRSPTMDETKNSEAHLTSAAAFVKGGIQDACDDACSICLENFCDSDPSTMTSCKHEFHLQCVLEWCQRSSQCPMCWQPVSLKDPTSQELLEAVEQERSFRLNPVRNSTIFRHPTFGDFELQHLPAGADDADLEERILQHLAAAAAMGQARHSARREGHRHRSGIHGRPQLLVFSSPPNSSSTSPLPRDNREGEAASRIMVATVSPPQPAGEESPQLNASASPVQTDQSSPSAPQYSSRSASQLGSPSSDSYMEFIGHVLILLSHTVLRRSTSQPVPSSQDRAGPSSELQSLSDSLKSRFNAMSMRYKDSIAKSTRGWKEKLFSRNTSMSDIGSEVRREVNVGIATVSRMMERLETRDARKSSSPESSNVGDNNPVSESNDRRTPKNGGNNPLSVSNKEGSCPAESSSS